MYRLFCFAKKNLFYFGVNLDIFYLRKLGKIVFSIYDELSSKD